MQHQRNNKTFPLPSQNPKPGVYKLDSLDRQLLTALDLNCRSTFTELSEQLSITRQAVEYRYKKLISSGVITSFNASVNPSKIGLRLYKINLKLRNDPQAKKELIEYLDSLGNVYWWGETSGVWDMLVGMFYQSEIELFRITKDLVSNFSRLIMDESGHVIVDILQFPKRYFTGELFPFQEYAGEIVFSSLDRLDYQIIAEIVNNARIPITEMAQLVRSTPAIIKGKLDRLESKGIIFQYRIGIDFKKLGLEYYKTLITLERYTDSDEASFMDYISKLPNIEFFLRNIWQIELELVVGSFDEYSLIIEEIKKQFPEIIRSLDTLMIQENSWTKGFKNFSINRIG